MSLKGRGQGVERGTSTRSLMRSIFFSFFGRAFPKEPLNRFPALRSLLVPAPARHGLRLRCYRRSRYGDGRSRWRHAPHERCRRQTHRHTAKLGAAAAAAAASFLRIVSLNRRRGGRVKRAEGFQGPGEN
ncbi:hypothetical protein PR202_ga16423 [Eleusine coracana subsp. coracana]|uniref:Uncharacterized protein n=1 Tax=Eleusine coracana subsp. coracana TaxID=191504 RepID=A0AAV5CLY3_ELECO|nr:hypothetical protein PR202_ga16423 [Eleusine coracana subsp. coracana]